MIWHTWRIIRRYPYMLPVLIVIWLFIGVAWLINVIRGAIRAGCCDYCPEQKIICMAPCSAVSVKLQQVERVKHAGNVHPCRGCGHYAYGCDLLCNWLEKWEVRQ